MRNREVTVRMAKWAVKLGEFEITFVSTHAIKSRALSDFVAEWTPVPKMELEEQAAGPAREEPDDGMHWTMFFDGSRMLQGVGAGVLLLAPMGEQLRYVVQLDFPASNNIAEYEALLAGLWATMALSV